MRQHGTDSHWSTEQNTRGWHQVDIPELSYRSVEDTSPVYSHQIHVSTVRDSSSTLKHWVGRDEKSNDIYTRFRNSHARDSSSTLVNTVPPTISDLFALWPNPDVLNDGKKDDIDDLHNPDPNRDYKTDQGGHICTSRGFMNLGCILLLVVGMLGLFIGYPAATFFTEHPIPINVTLEEPVNKTTPPPLRPILPPPKIPSNFELIDHDTPESVRMKVDYVTGKSWQLVFSDEFNIEGRTFYPGDDPFWEAVNLHYWQTSNQEWYDPAAVTTRNGSLEITLSDQKNHGLDYTGGMLSTWNKFCFTGGLVEASVSLPGSRNVAGLWPAIWAMGNLGRAGYGATLEGMWPYSYDACDVGTAPNQTFRGRPRAATVDGDRYNDGILSFQPGQKLSRCTCPGESHPGPVDSNGEFVGRGAPEIDMFEAQIGARGGEVSQSAQWAPYDYAYEWNDTATNYDIADADVSHMNTYRGGVYQQPTSVVTVTNQRAYEFSGGQYAVYGFQYKPGFGDAYLAWIVNGVLSWQLNAAGVGANARVEISDRPISQEPMYLIMNLGLSEAFGRVDYDHLRLPSKMRVDWIRVYQDPENHNVGCDPPQFPTKAYIDRYIEAYTNPNLTTWVDDYHQPWPRNKFLGEC